MMLLARTILGPYQHKPHGVYAYNTLILKCIFIKFLKFGDGHLKKLSDKNKNLASVARLFIDVQEIFRRNIAGYVLFKLGHPLKMRNIHRWNS